MNNSYITIIKEKRTALSRKRVPLNQNECTDDFRIGVPFEQNLHTIPSTCNFFDSLCNNSHRGIFKKKNGSIKQPPFHSSYTFYHSKMQPNLYLPNLPIFSIFYLYFTSIFTVPEKSLPTIPI